MTVDLSREEVNLLEAALGFTPFRDMITDPKTPAIVRRTYRAAADKLRATRDVNIITATIPVEDNPA